MMMMSEKSTERFSNRVEDYVKYRPHYPTEIMAMLRERYHVDKDKLIADIGAGTGISSELFLKAGFRVTGIEPNREMREKAAFLLQDYTNFTVLDGTAENTGLPDASVDVIIAGQAFHWFDRQLAKKEFKRTLKKGGLVVYLSSQDLQFNRRFCHYHPSHFIERIIVNRDPSLPRLSTLSTLLRSPPTRSRLSSHFSF